MDCPAIAEVGSRKRITRAGSVLIVGLTGGAEMLIVLYLRKKIATPFQRHIEETP